MAIEIRCPSCNALIEVPDKNLEAIKSCPKCGQRVELPGPEPAQAGPVKAEGPSRAIPPEAPLTVVKPHRSRMAIASLVLGILSLLFCLLTGILSLHFCLLTAIAAIILDALALSSINRSKGALTGKGMAYAGRWLGLSALLVLAVMIAIPGMLSGRISANETAAIGSLKSIASSQEFFKKARKVDQDGNGIGEYGLLGELCGELALRPGTTLRASPPFISQEFRTGGSKGTGSATKVGYHYKSMLAESFAVATGSATKGGYHYKIYLSNATAADPSLTGSDKELGGNATTGGRKASDAAIKLQEGHFVVYAWPADLHNTGERAFVVTEEGQVYGTRMTDATGRAAKQYNGSTSEPAADAAFIGPVFSGKLSSMGTPGNDGNQWNPVGG